MILKKVNKNNVHLINSFLDNAQDAINTFTYYNKRNMSVVENHLVTYIGFFENQAVSYGHLDLEKKKIWLGVAVSSNYQKLGFGRSMMNKLILFAKRKKINKIHLSVSKSNLIALSLYKKFGFEICKESDNNFECVLTLK
ncbi:GNAT family N-acetyltransferase [Alphaproteobacteria bacterium]|nr:GNAT family N-acetyltransferase [Alphaproteobacteria bacterium]